MKDHGVDFDSVVYLAEQEDEEEAGGQLKARTQNDPLYDFEVEAEIARK